MDRLIGCTPFYAGFWGRRRIDQAIAGAACLAHGVLLDIGCGNKPYQEVFAPRIEKCIGLEYSPETGYRGNKADLCGDAMRLPLADESVDTILCTEVLEHVCQVPKKQSPNLRRVLKPNGVVITTAPFFLSDSR